MPNNKLPPELKRNKYVKVSVNQEEWTTIEQAKRNRKGATWIREAVLWACSQDLPEPQPVRRTPEPTALLKAIWTELVAIRAQAAGIGRNANQAARKLNSHVIFDFIPIFIDIDRNVTAIREQLEVIYEAVGANASTCDSKAKDVVYRCSTRDELSYGAALSS